MARVVDLQAVDGRFGLLWRKHFIEGSGRVRIQVVHHDHHFARFEILFLQYLLHEERPILLRAMLGHFQAAFAC